jgi:NTP pyrophosphatase (non-canonical NTP hydrolase)
MNFHNPQNFGLEEISAQDGFRMLTVEEAAVLTDTISARTLLGVEVFTRLEPELYNLSACRWQKVIRAGGTALSQNFTYRTQFPLMAMTETAPVPVNLEAAAADFVESHNFLAAYHHEIMIEKGFWKSRDAIVLACKNEGGLELEKAARAAVNCQALALVATEVSEMVEGIRHGNGPDDKIPEFSAAEAEAADVYLRLMDLAHGNGWRIAEATIAKIAMNKTRAPMHGGKQF